MKMTLQVIIEDEDHDTLPIVKEVFRLERQCEELCPETLGLKLDEAKGVLAEIQTALVMAQATRFLEQQSFCPDCGMPYPKNGTHQLTFRTLFGTIKLASQRFYTCSCSRAKARRQGQKQISVSPLANLLPERTAPEFVYLQTKWAAVMSYGRTAAFLEEVLPLEKRISTAVLSGHVQQIAARLDSELGDEQWSFVEGCQQEWEQLPEPGEPLIVGIDGGYVHAREGHNRKAGFFEIIVGKSMLGAQSCKRFGFVNTYETKPKRRLYETLKSQGLQMNQQITFLSDGGDDVRNLQLYLSPFAEHVLDWKGGCSCAGSSLELNILPLEISFYLLPEEALGKGGNKANLDEQPQDRFSHGQTRIGIAQRDRLSKKASSMKAAETQHQRFIPA